MDTGIVQNIIDDKKAIVALNLENCGGCTSYKSCSINEKGNNLIEAEYIEKLLIGDNVKIIFKPKARILSSALIFMAPLFILILFYYMSDLFLKNENLSIIISFISFIIYFLILIPILKKNKFFSDLKPHIEKIN